MCDVVKFRSFPCSNFQCVYGSVWGKGWLKTPTHIPTPECVMQPRRHINTLTFSHTQMCTELEVNLILLERLLESLGLRNLLESLEGRQALRIHRKTLVISLPLSLTPSHLHRNHWNLKEWHQFNKLSLTGTEQYTITQLLSPSFC